MKNQVYNPFLPSYEYIPDGEPRVFGGRLYIYGSHDRFNANIFCVNDYVCWSAPLDDLSGWRYEGVIYKKNQDPKNKSGKRLLFAPDVVLAPDGRYYMYYALDIMGIMGVAVCDAPAGEYQFLGHVHFPDGHLWGTKWGEPFPFDPGVLADDDGRIYLYSGFGIKVPFFVTRMKNLRNDGAVVLELERDMLTIKTGPKLLISSKRDKSSSFFGHEFFEASSMRKIGGKYHFIYSSVHNHELCYAVSDYPDRDFTFAGTLVSIGDVGIGDCTDEARAKNYLSNTHGSIAELGGEWYVFYHRQTNRHSFSRQACAERLQTAPDGRFLQAELTSCGLNGGPLSGQRRYSAHIACNLWSAKGVGRYDKPFAKRRLRAHPYLTQTGKDSCEAETQYIAGMRDGAVAGFKYFDLVNLCKLGVELRGRAKGTLLVATDPKFEDIIAQIQVKPRRKYNIFYGACNNISGVHPLYFKFHGAGAVDFKAFALY
ncbi:MAG: family 43 glycosylhydrolase [Oscillospiraceae bacterium]|nr:family 43 glycosylhydrolase [Oscillospiraceae bacterium]